MNPVVIVTGGSRGIGAATARLASQRGYAVCVNYRSDEAAAQAVVQEINSVTRAVAVQADVSREEDVVRLFEETTAALGPVTALVNNAATMEHQVRLDAMDAARLLRMFSVNAIGPMLCAREAVRRMATTHGGTGGSIVNVSSIAAKLGSPGEYIDYAATKGALETFTVGLAKEVATEGIRVNAVRSGSVYTKMHAKSGEPDRVERITGRIPMQRGGQPEEIAQAILWLLSHEASYVTGAIVDVAGGL